MHGIDVSIMVAWLLIVLTGAVLCGKVSFHSHRYARWMFVATEVAFVSWLFVTFVLERAVLFHPAPTLPFAFFTNFVGYTAGSLWEVFKFKRRVKRASDELAEPLTESERIETVEIYGAPLLHEEAEGLVNDLWRNAQADYRDGGSQA